MVASESNFPALHVQEKPAVRRGRPPKEKPSRPNTIGVKLPPLEIHESERFSKPLFEVFVQKSLGGVYPKNTGMHPIEAAMLLIAHDMRDNDGGSYSFTYEDFTFTVDTSVRDAGTLADRQS